MTKGVIVSAPTVKAEGKGWTVVRPEAKKGEHLLDSRVSKVMSDAKQAIEKMRRA